MSKKGIVLMSAGVVLILAALLLFLHNWDEDVHAGETAENLLSEVQTVISERSRGNGETEHSTEDSAIENTATDGDDSELMELVSIQVDRYEYVGYITISPLGIELPVMSEWDYDRLKVAPCRQFGSVQTNDLVIAAHNYDSHFGRLKDLRRGDVVTFTDMDGKVYTYAVDHIEILDPTQVDEVQNSEYDLVLYTCTKGGETRITVFCDRA